jgi:hypothetical protein
MPPLAPIGGYFELELPQPDFPHSDALLLNSGRACLEYVLRAKAVRHLYLPRYTCDVVLEPVERLGMSWSFYPVDERLEMAAEVGLGDGEMLVLNNYFGVKDSYCAAMAERYGERLILDCSQAWFAAPTAGCHSFYSPRKFFGLPDGGCLHGSAILDEALETDTSHQRASHLLKRIDMGAEEGYAEFQRNDASLIGEPMRRMSRLTRRLLGSIDHEAARRRRLENFAFLHEALGSTNMLDCASGAASAGPMVYPYLSRREELRARLIGRKIFVATYWPNVVGWCSDQDPEHRLARDLLPLPIDQRYGPEEMARIVETIQG